MRQKKIFGFDYTDNEYVKLFMYLLVGGSAALFEWAMFYVLFQTLRGLSVFAYQTQAVLTATATAFALSTLYHYILCNRFVFDSGSRYKAPLDWDGTCCSCGCLHRRLSWGCLPWFPKSWPAPL